MSKQIWSELLLVDNSANGATVSNTTTETILFPDFTIPAFYMDDGKYLRYTATGKLSNIVTTPGNLTFALRWGGVSGTILAQSSAIALNTTAQTDIMWKIWLDIVCRGNGSSGSLLTMGLAELAFKSTIQPEFMGSAGGASSNTPAAVTVDVTTNQALSLTAKFSIANSGNSITGMVRSIESLN